MNKWVLFITSKINRTCTLLEQTWAVDCRLLLLLTDDGWWWCVVEVWCWVPEVKDISWFSNDAESFVDCVSPLPVLPLWWGWWYTDTWGIGPGKKLVRTKYLATEEANATAVPTRRSADECGLLTTLPRLAEVIKPPGYEGRLLWPALTSYQYTFKHFVQHWLSMQWHAQKYNLFGNAPKLIFSIIYELNT